MMETPAGMQQVLLVRLVINQEEEKMPDVIYWPG